MINEFEFWEWFIKHNNKFADLDDCQEEEREKKLNDFLHQLHLYNKHLFFQISSGDKNSVNELIISADGDVNYFKQVRQLVNAAPKIDRWNIIAFKPPMGIGFKTKYKDILLDPKECWFLPLENDAYPDLTGLKIFVPDYDPAEDQKFLEAAYQILDTLLGEEVCALNIKHLEVDHLPNYQNEDELFELNDLPEYLRWKTSNLKN